ncbi:MAG: calcium/proton exchanger [Clostridium sp.]|uniref:calcium/proton exchanger n=1 Tax=Clostridium sp. TaxID=1506 RepID=UPI00303AF0E8
MKDLMVKKIKISKDNIHVEEIINLTIILVSIGLLFIKINSNILSAVIYSVSMIPLAILLGRGTSKISDYIGEKRGGLISATAGNVPELMMGLWSIKYGMISMAKAGILGAVVTNMLLGLGIAVFCGGIKFREQKFNKIIARTNLNMLFLVMFTIIIVSALNRYSFIDDGRFQHLSIIISGVLIGVYILGLVFSLYTHSNLFILGDKKEFIQKDGKKETRNIFILIVVITILLYFISERLVENISSIIQEYKISQEFIGIILIPLLGSFGENASSIVCAMENKIDASLETAIGSSIQITMFVLPILIICSSFMGISINLLFSSFQIIIMAIAMGMSYFVFQDGKTYWFEGALLVAIYIVVTLSYYYVV